MPQWHHNMSTSTESYSKSLAKCLARVIETEIPYTGKKISLVGTDLQTWETSLYTCINSC